VQHPLSLPLYTTGDYNQQSSDESAIILIVNGSQRLMNTQLFLNLENRVTHMDKAFSDQIEACNFDVLSDKQQ